MTEFREHTVQCLSPAGFHTMAYIEWGDVDNDDVVVCVHGLTRCSRDFDDLARALAPRYRVVCPDIVGRGRSGRLKDPQHYGIPQYAADMVTLLARLDPKSLCWVGTSMGGLIGMSLAAKEDTPIQRLVLNDVGAVVSGAALDRIGAYVVNLPRLENMAHAEAVLRVLAAPFGPLTDTQWRHLATHSVVQAPDGKFDFHYDPAIAIPLLAAAEVRAGQDLDLWPTYDAIKCPTLVLRGAESDLLTINTARAMTSRGPRAELVEFAGIGHAPTLMAPDQIAVVADFL